MGNDISKNQFVNQLNKRHGTIDLNNMSQDLKDAISKAGIEAEVKALAGPDGQIKGKTEYKKLFDLVDRYDNRSGDSFSKYDNPKAATPVPTKSKELFDALDKEINKNRLEARYAEPGKKAAAQPALKEATDALVVDVKDRKPAVNLSVQGKNQFDFADGETACFKAATHQCEQFNKKQFGSKAPELEKNANQHIQVAYAEDKKGKVVVDKDQLKIGHAYIDNTLDKGFPVNVGISHEDSNINYDKMTDHFVTIYGRGYDNKGRLYYDYKDPGNSGKDGRMYVDKTTGKFFKEGPNPKSGFVVDHDWEMTKVQTYKNLP